MRKIDIAYIDFWKGFEPDNYFIHKILCKHFEVNITQENPDFVICGTFGNNFLKYDCPRLLFVGETYFPDFNLYDYAVGFDRVKFGDRYLRYPLCLMDKEILRLALSKHTRPDSDFLRREKFCSFVVSASGGLGDVRNWFFDRISEYKRVDSGGKFRNNLPDGKPVKDKRLFQEQYKFSLCFENTSFPGYATEKLLDAWASGTIPIYYGDPEITKDFNENAFINVRGKEDIEEVLKRIKELDNNQEAYLKMVHEPIIADDSQIKDMLTDEYLEDFLVQIFSQEKTKAYRRNSKLTMWGHFYEYRISKWNRLEQLPMVKFLRKYKRKIFGLKQIIK